MHTHTDKTLENKSQSIANEPSQKQRGGESTFQFVDNRPEAVAQRKLQEIANNSSQVSQLRAFQDMANNIPQAKKAVQLQSIKNNESPNIDRINTSASDTIQMNGSDTEEEYEDDFEEYEDDFEEDKDVDEALKELKKYPVYNALENEIREPVLERTDSNCHGFSLNNKISMELPLALVQSKPQNVMIFVNGNTIQHSGRIEGSKLIHFLIGVGVVVTTIDGSTLGYEKRFRLPDEESQLLAEIKKEDLFAVEVSVDKFKTIKETLMTNNDNLTYLWGEEEDHIKWTERFKELEKLEYTEENLTELQEWLKDSDL